MNLGKSLLHFASLFVYKKELIIPIWLLQEELKSTTSYFLIAGIGYLENNKVRKEGLILVYGSRWIQCLVVETWEQVGKAW